MSLIFSTPDTGGSVEQTAQVAELQANYDGWVKVGVLERVIRCNPGNRINEAAGVFESQGHNDYRAIQGY